MDATGPTVHFVGDLDDPWVREILGSIADLPEVHAVMCAGEVPERLFEPDQPPRLLIVHRTRLSQADAVRIDQWRSVARANAMPRVILCFSPYVRYAELERCARGVDLTIPEATAVETLSRHVGRLLERRDEPRRAALSGDCLPVQVISSNHELQAVLSEICLAEGFQVTSGREFPVNFQGRAEGASPAASQVLTLWDIPELEPDWARSLEQEGLAKLWTVHGKNRLTLLPYLIGDDAGLVTIWNDNGAYLSVWRSVFERRAPNSIVGVEAAIGTKIGTGNTVRLLTADVLEALTSAYREAGQALV